MQDWLSRLIAFSPVPRRRSSKTHPAMAFPTVIAPQVAEACRWLWDRNVALARDWGLGLEGHYAFDQEDAGRLTLEFGRGRSIVVRGQILGSFDPRDRSFMWAWANSSIQPDLCVDATRFKAEGERLGLPALTEPVQEVKFDQMTALLAYAAQRGGADGLYRCMVNDVTSLFIAFRIDDAARKAHRPPAADKGLLDAAHALAVRYDAEMLGVDKAFHEQETKSGSEDNGLPEAVDRKVAIYRRYWARKDDYWKPVSIGWPSDHDPREVKLRFTVPHPQDGALDIAIREGGQTVYRIETVRGALKITDQLIGWGNGFVWPSAPSRRSGQHDGAR